MSYNGSGTFQINTSGQPVVAGTVISSTAFNALTADLATGLSTAITKDGQTTTTVRIPFAAGINSTLVTDSTNSTSGSIITAGGVGIAKALYVGTTANVAGAVTLQSTLGVTGVATFSAAPIYSSLTVSSAVATDASKALVSVTNTGTGNNVLATSPTLVTPVLGAASATSITVDAGAVGTPSITTTGDTNTGIFFPAADTTAFSEGGVESMRIDSAGNVGIGTTSPQARLHESSTNDGVQAIFTGAQTATTQTILLRSQYHTNNGTAGFANIGWLDNGSQGGSLTLGTASNGGGTTGIPTERMRIDSSGDVCIGKTSAGSLATNGIGLRGSNDVTITTDSAPSLYINRNTNDGPLVQFRQANTEEGSISVSGTTVSYNGGHLSRWAQMLTKPDLLKGTVMSNLDEMNVYTDADGNPVDNEQLNKVKVSDVEGDANVAGVFVNWSHDDAHDVDEINMAMTGDMIIRIAQGTTVQRGDLLMSAGDGTAKPQGDDIVRSKTVAKVTSTHVTCTYADGSFCVPCVLMAC
jgi:hypothetical protein